MRLIRICGKDIPVVAQKHAKLRNRLSRADLEAIMTSDYAAQSYRVLGILIPALPEAIPLWEWEGYLSQEDMEAYRIDLEGGNAPTTEEMVNAFEAAFLESGADRLGKIVDLGQTAFQMTQDHQIQTPTPPSPGSPGSTGE